MTAEFAEAVNRLVAGIEHWTPAAWSAAAPGMPSASRADAVHGLVWRLAELAADSEGVARNPLPRLDNDLALPDQLRVLAADLIAARPAPPTLATALAAARTAHRSLWP